ncbi:Serine/threonine protein kinase [Singulisphaera sp. GP187]|uniref:protein kinase domain-containing protein n=1 Tax=Singulisphaera sp. GP187 TaxID=1882752 RepID=UPI000925C911|nr:protein kinase [Singulisphaera sp. GP187]SIO65153.1 Serine/threonine protein kinase [Singulisphaera sp. GP187]
MRRGSSACDPEGLRWLLNGGVPEPRRAELIEHLDACAPCRSALEELAAGERWWEDARQFVGTGMESGPNSGGHHRGGTILGDGGSDAPGGAHEGLDFLTPSASPGSLGCLGPYEILGVLGRGGMGLVLRGHDPALNRPVAIKVLAPGAALGALARRRFAREARAAAAVVHEHVVAIHAVDESGGRPYLVMQYVAGRSLQERIDRDGPLRVEEVLRIGMQAALGLAAAHAQGLIHRDVKPANILLENGVERVKLTDFGLARAVDDSSLTHFGVVAGTPQYMAPEQARGEPVDPRSDLFSLGSVLYAMCAGRSPFRAESTPAVLRRICDEQPRPIREVNPDVPEWLEAIMTRLHAKEPAGRYQSATEVAEIFATHLARLQEPGRKPPHAGPGAPAAIKGRARPQTRAMALILLGICGAAATAGLTWSFTSGAQARRDNAFRTSRMGRLPEAIERVSPSGPTRTIAGIVRDRDSGKSIPGVRLTLAGLPVAVTSDPQGRYELRGPAKSLVPGRDVAGRFDVAVEPAPLPFLAMNIEVVGDDGDDTIQADIGLSPGIPFRLRLTDGATGGPVRAAQVVYRPLHPNPFADGLLPPGASSLHSRAAEGPDGVYSGVMIPGPGAIGVESYAEHYGPVSVDPVAYFVPGELAARGVDASTVFGTRQLLAVETGGGYGIYYWPQGGMSGVLLVDPRPGQGPVEFKLSLRDNRVGRAAR